MRYSSPPPASPAPRTDSLGAMSPVAVVPTTPAATVKPTTVAAGDTVRSSRPPRSTTRRTCSARSAGNAASEPGCSRPHRAQVLSLCYSLPARAETAGTRTNSPTRRRLQLPGAFLAPMYNRAPSGPVSRSSALILPFLPKRLALASWGRTRSLLAHAQRHRCRTFLGSTFANRGLRPIWWANRSISRAQSQPLRITHQRRGYPNASLKISHKPPVRLASASP